MRKFWLYLGVIVALAFGVWFLFLRGPNGEPEIEYRYEAVKKGELSRSISATGQIVALTTVDVKSKAGGTVVRLAVDEGSLVKKGDLVAEIDPRDTKASYQQAQADLTQAQARASQAETNVGFQKANTRTSIASAEAAAESAKLRLERAKLEADRQPAASDASLKAAQAAFEGANQDLDRYRSVTEPQLRRDAQGAFDRADADLAASKADYERQQDLLKRGYVSQGAVERGRAAFQAAQATFATAKQKLSTLDKDIAAQKRVLELAVSRTQAQLSQAKADQAQIEIARKSYSESQKAFESAKLDLQRAKDATANNVLRERDRVAAQAATVRSKVAMENAQVQLDSTTVLAPRDGVVTQKYLEEGTIIPPGTSTFAQGTSIVQISDTTTLFVDCNVDEADIGAVKENQPVRIVTEAFPGQKFDGVVERVSPAAKTEQNITSVKVRVRILPGFKINLRPGLNATCEFIVMSKSDVLIAPSQAVQHEGEKTFVKIKAAKPDQRPARREVKVGETGDNGVEILEGLKEGEEVVTAEIDMKALLETQQKMQEAQEGGGLAGGMGPRRPGGARGGAGGAGGARGGMGGGAGGMGGGARGGMGGGGGRG